jgi:hypothetical protein
LWIYPQANKFDWLVLLSCRVLSRIAEPATSIHASFIISRHDNYAAPTGESGGICACCGAISPSRRYHLMGHFSFLDTTTMLPTGESAGTALVVAPLRRAGDIIPWAIPHFSTLRLYH